MKKSIDTLNLIMYYIIKLGKVNKYNWKEYKILKKLEFDYSKLKGLIREKGETQESIAEKLSMSKSSFNQKINDKQRFTQTDICKLVDILDIVDLKGYFFSIKS